MQYYVPFAQVPAPPMPVAVWPQARGLLLRTGASADALAAPIRRAVVGSRMDLPFLRVVPYTQLFERQMRPWRLGTALLTIFSGLALGVVAIGLYAAFAHAVASRRREMAIRLALGARRGRVVGHVIREAMRLAAVGVAVGWAATVAAGRWMQSLLYETAPTDLDVLAIAAAFLFVVAAAAVIGPARQAATADPNTLLRVE
jgi:predicted lysophospholipase L1 biosynthesis ABC-type transport system permease subunit